MSVLVVAVLIFGGSPLAFLPVTIVFMFLMAVFALGVSLVLSVANVYFRDTQHFVAILMQLWFYLTPIVYPISIVEHEAAAQNKSWLVDVYRLNPIERFTEVFRNTIYDGRLPSLNNTLVLVGVSAVTLAVGYRLFKRYEGRLAEEL
jgi:ABC-2 type transport system permease protein